MTQVAGGLMESVWFGFDAERLLIRVDTRGGPAREILAEADRLRIGFVEPSEREIVVMQPESIQPVGYLNHAGGMIANGTTIDASADAIFELGVPFARLEIRPGDSIRFYVELERGATSLDRAPREGIFELVAPSTDFERIMWQV
jgi:hypothetical protein